MTVQPPPPYEAPSLSLSCVGVENTTERFAAARAKINKQYPTCAGATDAFSSLGYEGQAKVWEVQMDRLQRGNYGSCIGYGLLSRVHRTAAYVVGVPMAGVNVVTSVTVAALGYVVGTICCPCHLIEAEENECWNFGHAYLGHTALSAATIVKDFVILIL